MSSSSALLSLKGYGSAPRLSRESLEYDMIEPDELQSERYIKYMDTEERRKLIHTALTARIAELKKEKGRERETR